CQNCAGKDRQLAEKDELLRKTLMQNISLTDQVTELQNRMSDLRSKLTKCPRTKTTTAKDDFVPSSDSEEEDIDMTTPSRKNEKDYVNEADRLDESTLQKYERRWQEGYDIQGVDPCYDRWRKRK
ncbi:hypothetical protein AC249_AIPGENE8169, partial [Exaiptasia diaphana]